MCLVAKPHLSLLWSFKVFLALGSINIGSLRDREPERWKTIRLIARTSETPHWIVHRHPSFTSLGPKLFPIQL
jgi:hypothetical protein